MVDGRVFCRRGGRSASYVALECELIKLFSSANGKTPPYPPYTLQYNNFDHFYKVPAEKFCHSGTLVCSHSEQTIKHFLAGYGQA